MERALWTDEVRLEASDYALKLGGPRYDFKSLSVYALFAFTPVFLEVVVLFSYLIGDFVHVPVPTDTPKLILYSIPIFICSLGIEVVVGWNMGKLSYFRFADSISSLFAGISDRLLGSFWGRLLVGVPYVFINANFSLTKWTMADMTWVHWTAMFFLYDLVYYWAHRMGHEWNISWAGHNIHHSSDEYNLCTALRQTWWFSFTAAPFPLPLAFFFPYQIMVAHAEFSTFYQFWIHTRLVDKFHWVIEFIFNTPSHHRVHHGRNPQYIDKNYGGTTILWDRVFGTFEPEEEEVVYGITHMPSTWDPLTVQTHHWSETLEALKYTPGFWRKIRVFTDLGPGYNYFLLNYDPKLKGVRVSPKLTPETVPKLEVTVPNYQMVAYVSLHFALLTARFAHLLFNPNHSLLARLLVVVSVLFQQYSIGALFDQRASGPFLEIFSHILNAFVVFFLSGFEFSKWAVFFSVLAVISSAWVLHFQRSVSIKPKAL